MKFIFIRHAQSEGNKDHRHASPETPLSPEGLAEAHVFAEQVTFVPDVILCSPYRRALQTAEPLAARFGLPILVNDDLREKHTAMSGKSYEDVQTLRDAHPEFHDSTWGYDYRSWGGESGPDVKFRAERFIADTKAQYPGKTILAVSHGVFIRTIHRIYPTSETAELPYVANVSVHEFDL